MNPKAKEQNLNNTLNITGKKEDFFTVNKMPNIPKTSEYDKDLFEEKYKNALILKNMLNEFRLEKQQINSIDMAQENNKI